jgi:hypothetical protein
LARCSPSGSGRVLSRQELAEAVNAWIYAHTERVCAIDARYIGKLERGETRWPAAHFRAGLRAVLGADTDRELGLFIVYGAGRSTDTMADSAGTEPAARNLLAPVARHADPSRALTPPDKTTGPAAIQIHVSAGTVTVVCHDGAAGRVAVVAGAVQVLIHASGSDVPTRILGVVDAPMAAGGARVYSLAARAQRDAPST